MLSSFFLETLLSILKYIGGVMCYRLDFHISMQPSTQAIIYRLCIIILLFICILCCLHHLY